MKNTRLPDHLARAQEEIENYAREYGLDFFPIIYEVLDYRTLYETAAFGGFPTRYPHWRFGMEYDQLLKGHIWQGSTIYEMVINTDPSYAYLLEGNETVTQKMVMAHVCAHVDFFKHNMWFAHTNRKMLDEMANHAARVHRIIERQGYEVVENFIDLCLSLDNLIDYHAPYIKRPDATNDDPLIEADEEEVVEGLKVEREYMRDYINPPDFLNRQRQSLEQERARQKKFPVKSQKDILLFLLNYAPLERWQHTILEIIRDEAYYFAPQGMTKILNEGWACVVAGTLLYTDQGLLPIEQIVQQRQRVAVADGQGTQPVYDWATFADRPTITICTRRGFELTGSLTHRLLLADGQTWQRLDELVVGEQVLISGGNHLWAAAPVPLVWQMAHRAAADAPLPAAPNTPTLLPEIAADDEQNSLPTVLDASLATFLGAIVGSGGRCNPITGYVELLSDDYAALQEAAHLAADLLGAVGPIQQIGKQHWYWQCQCEALAAVLQHPDLAPLHDVPAGILRSPQPVVAAFLNAVQCWGGFSDGTTLRLTLDNPRIARTLQLLWLNMGYYAARYPAPDGSTTVIIPAVAGQQWQDEVVAIEQGRATVYDISVTQTHRYAAHGFINHNSFWHSEIMTKRAVEASEIISFADLHSGVVATGSGRLNPYKLGLELLRDIEERWNTGRFGKEYEECDDIAERRNWDRKLGLGRQKIFEIRKLYNDVTFIDEFLTPEFVMEQKLFAFRYNRDTDLYEIASREFAEIKQKLLFRLTNFGQPYITIEDANYNNRNELYLLHRFEGVELQMDYARETMRNLQRIWTRPVHLETAVEGRRRLLTFDGTDFSERRMD